MAERKQTGGGGPRYAHGKEEAGKVKNTWPIFGFFKLSPRQKQARWLCFVDAGDPLFCEHYLLRESEPEPERKRGPGWPAGRKATQQAREPADLHLPSHRQKGVAPRLAGKDTEGRAKS